MKTCSKCKTEKDFSEFHKHISGKYGLSGQCKQCIKKYREINKEKINQINKIYREHNKEYNKKYYKEYNKKYYKENKEKSDKKNKVYRETNKEKIKEYNKKYREKNKQYYSNYSNKYQKDRRQTDSIYKLKQSVRNNIRNSFKRGNNQFKKNARTESILGCTIEEFKVYIQSQFIKGMNWNNYGEWHLDHIIPIATAKTEEDVIKLCHYTNYQPLWAKENISKGAKIIEKQLVLL